MIVSQLTARISILMAVPPESLVYPPNIESLTIKQTNPCLKSKKRFICGLPPQIDYDQCKSGFYSPKSQCLCSPAWRLPSLSPREQSQGRDDGDLVPSVTDADLWRQATSTFVIGVRIRKVMLGPGDPLGRSPWFTPNYWLVHPRPHRILAIIVCLKMNWL